MSWDDDGIDDDMLVMASQMTEDMDTQVAGHRKDSLDEATLSMLITEVESDNTKAKDHARPGGPNHEEDRFLQTQIIFGAPSSSQPRHMMPPPSVNTRPMPRNSNQASSTSMAEMDKLRAENDRLTKEKTSKAGEISVLRDELRRKNAELEAERVAKTRLLKAKDQEIKAKDSEVKAKLENAKTEREFLAQELEQSRQNFRSLERKQENFNKRALSDTINGHSEHATSGQGSSKKPKLEPQQSPAERKRRLSKGHVPESFRLGFDVDSPLNGFIKPEPYSPQPKACLPRATNQQSPQTKITTPTKPVKVEKKDSECQTTSGLEASKRKTKSRRRNRLEGRLDSLVGRLNTVTLGKESSSRDAYLLGAEVSLIGTSEQEPKSVPSFSKDAFNSVQQLMKEGQPGLTSLQLILDTKLTTLDTHTVMAVLENVQSVLKSEVVASKQGQSVLNWDTLRNSFHVLARLCRWGQNQEVKEKIYAFVRDLVETFETSEETSYLRLMFNGEVFKFLRMAADSRVPEHQKHLCIREENSCFVSELCFIVTEDLLAADLEDFAPEKDGSSAWSGVHLSLVLEVAKWASANLQPQLDSKEDGGPWLGAKGCLQCKQDILKTLSLCAWAFVSRLSQMKEQSDHQTDMAAGDGTTSADSDFACSKLTEYLKSVIALLHTMKTADESSFVSSMGENPLAQRRYIWTFNLLLGGLHPSLGFTPEKEEQVLDLAVESDSDESE